jgi:hypothetical protein
MKKQTENKPKSKILFDHLKEITQIKREDYWNTLLPADSRTWSTYMINRYLSMNPDWVQLIDDLQPYTLTNQLKPNLVYLLYRDVIPKHTGFLNYTKSQDKVKYSKELIDIFMKYYNISKKESLDYLKILYSIDDGLKEVNRIVSAYGNDEKETKKIMKV